MTSPIEVRTLCPLIAGNRIPSCVIIFFYMDIYEQLKNNPEIINSSLNMTEANAPILIFEGEFLLRRAGTEIKASGKIQFDWLPISRTNITCSIPKDPSVTETVWAGDTRNFDVIINGLKFGELIITSTNFSTNTPNIDLKGIMAKFAVSGDKSIPVEKIRFDIPNLREFMGLPVKENNDKGEITLSKSRLIFENDEYLIVIDKSTNYRELYKSLKSRGGYIVLYTGELSKKKGALLLDKTYDIFCCLSTFLTFLNGRRTSAFFRYGLFDNKVLWQDYSSYLLDQYKSVTTWPQENSIEGLNELWQTFRVLWNNDDSRDFLTRVIHWYVEANSNAGFIEGAIVTTQIALELIYNWLIIENRKILLGKDSENIAASNKIRLILSQLNIDSNIPATFTNLQSFLKSNTDIVDGPDIFVQIRNAIIHSRTEKSKKMTKMDYKVKNQALQLGIWYVELSLLYILNFRGKYFNRCSGATYVTAGEFDVPWLNK